MPFLSSEILLPIPGNCSNLCGGGGGGLGSYHVLNLLKAGEQQELGGTFSMFQTGFKPGSNWCRRFGKKSSRKSGTSRKRTWACLLTFRAPQAGALQVVSGLFPDFSGRAMLFGAPVRIQIKFGARAVPSHAARPGLWTSALDF